MSPVHQSYNAFTGEKIQDPIPKTLSFELPAPYCIDEKNSSRYNLSFFISHLGNTFSSGHYICYVRHQTGGVWSRIDEETISSVTEAEAEKAASCAFLLRYRKQV